MATVTVKFKTDDSALIAELIAAFIEDEGITIRTASLTRFVDLTDVTYTKGL